MQLIKKNDLLTISYLIGTILFYMAIIFVRGNDCRFVYYFSIVFVFIFVLFSVLIKKKGYFVLLAMFFTLLADTFLVLIEPQNKLVGMIFFSFAQISYFLHLLIYQNKKLKIANCISRTLLVVIVLCVTILVLKDKVDFLSLISVFYYTNLILNLVFSFFELKQNFYLLIGFILFLCCDTIIGLQVAIGNYLMVSENSFLFKIAFTKFNLAWLFYFPSQVLISLGATNCFRLQKDKKNC